MISIPGNRVFLMCEAPDWIDVILLDRNEFYQFHDDVIKWKHFPHYWPFVRGIHRSPVISPHKGQWRGALIFSLICVWINGWVNNREVGNLRRYRAHYDVIVMLLVKTVGLTIALEQHRITNIMDIWEVIKHQNNARFNDLCAPHPIQYTYSFIIISIIVKNVSK